jgi:hypothetical protein
MHMLGSAVPPKIEESERGVSALGIAIEGTNFVTCVQKIPI